MTQHPIAAVVPTLGPSARLLAALRSLRETSVGIHVTLVHQGPDPPDPAWAGLCERRLHHVAPLGFAAANNLGFHSESPYWLLLNDDAELEPGWVELCLDHLERHPEVAAVQGINRQPPSGPGNPVIDGAGIGWSRSGWQARQLKRGMDASGDDAHSVEVFGVSATACLLRRSAVAAVALRAGEAFDPRLETYYEDVDLAVRLRSQGWSASCISGAVAFHVGGASAAGLGSRRLELLYGNRHLVIARLLGCQFASERRGLFLRDLRDALRQPAILPGVVAGWRRARTLLPHFAHRAAPLVARRELARFGAAP